MYDGRQGGSRDVLQPSMGIRLTLRTMQIFTRDIALNKDSSSACTGRGTTEVRFECSFGRILLHLAQQSMLRERQNSARLVPFYAQRYIARVKLISSQDTTTFGGGHSVDQAVQNSLGMVWSGKLNFLDR